MHMQCPLLCKEFVVDAWQIYYARSKGADAILLIAAVLPDLDIKYMTKICKMVGLTPLVEVTMSCRLRGILYMLLTVIGRAFDLFICRFTTRRKWTVCLRSKALSLLALTIGISVMFDYFCYVVHIAKLLVSPLINLLH